MGKRARKDVWGKLTLAHFAGNPVYFFDTKYLLENVSAQAGWNETRLEAAVAPRIENALTDPDAIFGTKNGFYVIFASFNRIAAREKAFAIRDDVFRHFYGPNQPPGVDKYCQLSSVQCLAEDMGAPPARMLRPPRRGRKPVILPGGHDLPDEREKPFERQMVELFIDQMVSDQPNPEFLFWPTWDSHRERVTAFTCESAKMVESSAFVLSAGKNLSEARQQCCDDVTALAAAAKAVRKFDVRTDAALITVPLHVETLSWSKTRNAYFAVLAQIDARWLSLLAPRLVGFAKGANLSLVSQWIALLRRHVPRSFVQMDAALDFSRAGLIGATGFFLTVTPTMRGPKKPSQSLVVQTANLKRICANQMAIPCVHNVATIPELYLVKAKGIRLIAGPVIEQGSLMPSATRELRFDDIGGPFRDDRVYQAEKTPTRVDSRIFGQTKVPHVPPIQGHEGPRPSYLN